MKKRRNFTPEQKSKMVMELLSGDATLTEVAEKYEIHPTQLQQWKKQFQENMGAAFEKGNSEESKELKRIQEENEALLKKVGQLSIEVDWLKKKIWPQLKRLNKELKCLIKIKSRFHLNASVNF